jgi:hypothetical protein
MKAETIRGAQFKVDDLVETPTGRFAQIIAVLPGNRREVVYRDDQGGGADLPVRLLTLVHSAPVKGFTRTARPDNDGQRRHGYRVKA